MDEYVQRPPASAAERVAEVRRTLDTFLDLSGLRLTSVPESVRELTHLQRLYLHTNHLTQLPDWIGRLTCLTNLSCSSNCLASLPESIGDLAELTQLTLQNNRLTSLPKSIGRLAQLQHLYVADNLLTSLPDSIGELSRLEVLELKGNRLRSLPQALLKLTSLERLELFGNEALRLPAEVTGTQPGRSNKPKFILDYYAQLWRGGRRLNEAKLILVGRGAVGKTSIVNRLVHDSFEPDERKTEGIRITQWEVAGRADESVRLNIWDFGGQEIMHATHQFFLTRRSLYLIVLSGREGGEDADADYWLKLVESFGGDSPAVVVLNKINQHPFDVNRRALQRKYPVREFVRTDCEDGTGIAELREIIERETGRLEGLRDAFPANWFSIKDRLAAMGKNYLSFAEYRQLCAEHGEGDRANQESLAGYLHNLGIILNYRDDPRLHDTHVLNPHWVTSGIYRLLNSRELERQQGEMRLADAARVLDAAEYPAGMTRFLFDLMKKFELCFSFPDDDTHYLVPELLDKQEPAAAAEFDPAECLNFQYHYPVLPEGLLPRFIVRTHVLSEGLPRWRTGTVLRFEGCRALVKADPQDKKIDVSVAGPAAGRRSLLAIIRSDFEHIHRDFPNLQPQEMIPLPGDHGVVVPYGELLVCERSGMGEFPKVVGGEIKKLNVGLLLNGVDLDDAPRRGRPAGRAEQRAHIFCSYAREDEHLRNELETHLKLLQRRGLVETWHDRRVEPGADWGHEIDENLERADIVLLLVSADFIASDYCYENEMRLALARAALGRARVLPIILRDVDWSAAPFARLQALPTDARPVSLWPDRDSAWRSVSEGIRSAAEEVVRGKRAERWW